MQPAYIPPRVPEFHFAAIPAMVTIIPIDLPAAFRFINIGILQWAGYLPQRLPQIMDQTDLHQAMGIHWETLCQRHHQQTESPSMLCYTLWSPEKWSAPQCSLGDSAACRNFRIWDRRSCINKSFIKEFELYGIDH